MGNAKQGNAMGNAKDNANGPYGCQNHLHVSVFFFCTNVLRIHYILFSCTRKRKHEQLTASTAVFHAGLSL